MLRLQMPRQLAGGCKRYTPFTRYNQLSNRLYNLFDNCVERTATVRSTGLNEQPLFVQPVVKPGCTTSLTTGCMHDTAGCLTTG